MITQLLVTDKFFKSKTSELDTFFKKTHSLRFWKKHFANNQFKLTSNKITKEYWQKIPTLSLNDILRVGFNLRLADSTPIVNKNIHKFMLRAYSRNLHENPVLFLESLPKKIVGKNNRGRLQITKSFSSMLRQTLISISIKDTDLLSLDSRKIDSHTFRLLDEIKLCVIAADPNDLIRLISIKSNKKNLKKIETVILIRPLMYYKNMQQIKEFFKAAKFISSYPLVGITSAIRSCSIAQKEFGVNVVHPKKNSIIEIVQSTDSEYGELIITTIKPVQLSLIRFKTNIFGRSFYNKCSCGASWNILLEREKKLGLNMIRHATSH